MPKVPALVLTALLLFAACGSDENPTVTSDDGSATTASGSASGSASAPSDDPYGGAYGNTEPDTGSATGTQSSGEGDTVTAVDYDFQPTELKVATGTKVKFTNDGDQPHTFTARDDSFDSGNVDPGESFEHTFGEAGTFEFRCEYHSNMEGTVTVS